MKQDATPGDIAWVEAHNLEYPGTARRATTAASLSSERLARSRARIRRRDQSGTTQTTSLQRQRTQTRRHHRSERYSNRSTTTTCAARDGYREVVVDSRGRIQDEIETVAADTGPRSGHDDRSRSAERRRRATREFRHQARRDHRDGSKQRRDPGARVVSDFRSESLFTTNHDEGRARRVCSAL